MNTSTCITPYDTEDISLNKKELNLNFTGFLLRHKQNYMLCHIKWSHGFSCISKKE